MNKMIDTGRFGNLDFVESAVTLSKSAKKKRRKKKKEKKKKKL